jgi:hypothetical protein
VPKPDVDGYIVSIDPNLVREDGSVPPVDVIHLHHGVWINLGDLGGFVTRRSAGAASSTNTSGQPQLHCPQNVAR